MVPEHAESVSLTEKCSTHAASGNIQRLSSSQSMPVSEVGKFVQGLRLILRIQKKTPNFKLWDKIFSLLNDVLHTDCSFDFMDKIKAKIKYWILTTTRVNVKTQPKMTMAKTERKNKSNLYRNNILFFFLAYTSYSKLISFWIFFDKFSLNRNYNKNILAIDAQWRVMLI